MRLRSIVLILFALGGVAIGVTVLTAPPVQYPKIVPASGAGSPIATEHLFRFENGTETLRVALDPAVYHGAKANAKEVRLREEIPEEEWMQGAYLVQIGDPAQEPFYADLLSGFRTIRDREALDDDRYLELLATAVQQLPYTTAPGTAAKYPIETWGDRSGDCDDKSLLLAGLLAREGYRVALLVFLAEAHMAVGIGCPPGYGYNGTGYAYIEVTNTSFVGAVPDEIGTGVRLVSSPLVVPVGNGTREYGALAETAAIEAVRKESGARVDLLGPEIEGRKAALEETERRLNLLSSSGDHPRFDSEYLRYRADAAACDRLVDEHNRLVQLLNYISSHEHDRIGTAAYVSAHPI
jgi:hypothetical protein